MNPGFEPKSQSSDSEEIPEGLGVITSTPDFRARSYTLDSFNISSIEKSHSIRRPPPTQDPDHHGDWETATWVFSEILQTISSRDKEDVRLLITKSNQLVNVLKENPSLKKEMVIQNVLSKINFMLYHSSSPLRCAAYRVLRHCISGEDSVLFLVRAKILIFVIVTLSTLTPLREKEEALKLIREFIEIPNGTSFISIGVVRALVALVEHENENILPSADNHEVESHASPGFIRMCIETICELSVSKPDVVFHGGGFRLLIYLLIDGPSDIAAFCMMAILTLLDQPNSRLFFRNGFDLDSLVSVFSNFEDDDTGKTPNTKKYYNRSLKIAFLISTMVKTWTGMISFSRNKFRVIKDLISNLKKRNNKLRGIILDFLLDILHIRALPWVKGSPLGEIVATYRSILLKVTDSKDQININYDYHVLIPGSFEHSIISHFQGLLAKVLFNCDLIPFLVEIIDENRDSDITDKATYLLTNVLQIAINQLPKAFYDDFVLQAYSKPMSISAMAKIEKATRSQHHTQDGKKKSSEIKELVKSINIQSRLNVDDATFKSMISKTKIFVAKEFEVWNWSAISDLFQGPLRNPKRFSEIQEKYPKFMKTLMSFFRPFKFRFGNLPNYASRKFPTLKAPKKLIGIGCQILETLLSFEDGYKFLLINKLLPQIAEIVAQVDPYSGIGAKEPILSKRRLEESLSIGYVKFIGVLSDNQNGLYILENWRMFQLLNDIVAGSSEDDSNNYFIFALFPQLNFTHDSQLRLLLANAIAVSNTAVKNFILHKILPKYISHPECEEMVISHLCTLMYDEDDGIVKHAVEMLHDFYILKSNLHKIDLFIGFSPSIEVLTEFFEGRLLLFNFCTTTKGFRYLHKSGFIETCFNESIKKLHGFDYLILIEKSLRAHLFPQFEWNSQIDSVYEYDLHHFFKYLLATEEGFNFFNSRRHYIDEAVLKTKIICEKLNLLSLNPPNSRQENFGTVVSESAIDDSPFLALQEDDLSEIPVSYRRTESELSRNTNDLTVFRSNLKHELLDDEEEYLLRRLKQFLWVFGEIASANYGIQILDPLYTLNTTGEHIIETIYQLFEISPIWQLRGLAFYQLGKLASTAEGAEFLDDLQWVSLEASEKDNLALAYPKSMDDEDIFYIERLNPYEDLSYYALFGTYEGIEMGLQVSLSEEIVYETYTDLDDRIMSLINHLSSVLGRIERKATKELKKIKNENPEMFSDINLFLKVIRLVDKGKFKFRTRVFLFDLFNTSKILEGLLKRDRKASMNKSAK